MLTLNIIKVRSSFQQHENRERIMEDKLAGINLATRLLKSFEEKIDPAIDGKSAIRMARESIEMTAAIMFPEAKTS